MSNNIHSLNSFNNNNSNANRNRDDYLDVNSPAQSRSVFRTICPYLKFLSLSFIIIIVNILIYLLELLINYKSEQIWNCTLYNFGAKFTPAIQHDFHLHRLLLPITLHASFAHLFMNTISLLFLTTFAEHFLGTLKFSALYILSGLYSFLLSAIANTTTLSVGASGSIMGLSGFYIVYYIVNYRSLNDNDKKFFFIFVALTLMNLFQTSSSKGEAVDMFGHIGGFIAGVCLTILLYGTEKINFDDIIVLFRKLRIAALVVFAGTVLAMTTVIFYMNVEENWLSRVC